MGSACREDRADAQIVSWKEGAVWRKQFAVANYQRISGTQPKLAQRLENGFCFWQPADRSLGLKSDSNGSGAPGVVCPGKRATAMRAGVCCFCHGRFRNGMVFMKIRSGNIQINEKSNKPEKGARFGRSFF